jgi:hypothetical protein
MIVSLLAGLFLLAGLTAGQQFPIPQPSERELMRNTYHRVTTPVKSYRSPAPEPGAESTHLISPLIGSDGARVRNAEGWYTSRRPELLRLWTAVLGKTSPAPADMKWFGNIRAVERSRIDREGYTRIDLDLFIQRDLRDPYLLLLPKEQGPGPFPVVIAWTSSTPDYRQPEVWWGAYLASHGFVVLTSQGTRRSGRTVEQAYERFGHWLGLGMKPHVVARQIEYLRSVPQADINRIGFIGFSWGAKAAVYVAAFNPDVKVTVAVDPHIAINGGTNWYSSGYLDWLHKFDDIRTSDYPIPELRGTVQSLLNPDVTRPGFERDHHELLALVAPRAFLLIGGSQSEDGGGDSDDLQSWGYVNRAKEVYKLLGVPERLQYCSTSNGHRANGKQIDPAWQTFFRYFLKEHPIEFHGYGNNK